MFITLMCSLIQTNCQERAAEYWSVGTRYNFDPVLLVAIDIYECDLHSSKQSNKFPRDLCPMGLRVYQHQKLMSRIEILDRATARLDYFRRNTINHSESYAFLDHYNSGWVHIHNKYGWQIIGIYNTLYKYNLTNREISNLNLRTKSLIKDINHAFDPSNIIVY